LHGDPEQRESAALGIGELVRLSSEATLKPVAIKVRARVEIKLL